MDIKLRQAGLYSLAPDDQAGCRAIAEMSQKANGCEQNAERSMTRLTASDEDGWRNIGRAWEEHEREDASSEVTALRCLMQEVLDHWHSDSWALSPFAGFRAWQKRAVEALNSKRRRDESNAPASLYAGSDLRVAEVQDDVPVWL
jgi:hypothetical protein